ncbi:hypothetical protein WA026_004797 [Henosepilachna vigintioctopunctata]|uniref:Uncharacterized protein n=1 Tax=Henosepilachna vigintioctopunctata TaxID=420089 RepID=A0AAW1V7J1_9CUCU
MLWGFSILMCSTWVLHLADTAPAISKSRQFIAPLPGYIPVYIRPGDTPLEDINLDLAEAFEIYAAKHGRFNFGRSSKVAEIEKTDISEVKLEEEENNQLVPVNKPKETVINLNDLSLGVPVAISLPDLPEPTTYVHIQKIPRKPAS